MIVFIFDISICNWKIYLCYYFCTFPRICLGLSIALGNKRKDEDEGGWIRLQFFLLNENSKYVQGFLSPIGLTRNGNSVYRNALAALEMQ